MKINREFLIKICLFSSILLIFILYLIFEKVSPERVSIRESKFMEVGSRVIISGIVKKVKFGKPNVIVVCEGGDCIEVRFFFEKYVKEGDFVFATGVIREWGQAYLEVKNKEDLVIK